VKAFNNINYKHLAVLARPVGAADRTTLPIAGNDPGAKKHAVGLLSLLGYDFVDIGPLTESWRSQVGTPAFCAPYAVTKDDHYLGQPAAPASAAEVSAAPSVGPALNQESHMTHAPSREELNRDNSSGHVGGPVIIVGVDGSDPSWDALAWAAGEALRSNSRIVAVFATTSFEAGEVLGSTPPKHSRL
jgi:hypothetical protein